MKELSLVYRIDIPESASDVASRAELPLFLLVHGRAGNVDVMWAFRRSLPQKAIVISVQAPEEDSIGGFSWWKVEGEITDEMIEIGVKKLRNFIEEVFEMLGFTTTIHALGFSQGSGALSVLLQREPELFEKLGILAGFVIKKHDEDALKKSFMKPAVLIAHGSEDKIVPLTRAEDGKIFLEERGVSVTLVTDPVGHKVGSLGMRAIKEFFGGSL
jgi:predicted esterase